MIDQHFMAANPMPVPDHEEDCATPAGHESLEQRLCRLEDAVASLQDTRRLEERVVERVAERIGRESASAAPATAILVEAGRPPLPAAYAMVGSQVAAEPVPDFPGSRDARPAWLLIELYQEWQAIGRMFFDRRRFRVRWSGYVIPLAALFLMLCTRFLFGGLWIVGDLVCWVVDMVLIIIAYKALSREAARYRASVAFPTATPVPKE